MSDILPVQGLVSGSEGYYRPVDTSIVPIESLDLSLDVEDEVSLSLDVEEDIELTLVVE